MVEKELDNIIDEIRSAVSYADSNSVYVVGKRFLKNTDLIILNALQDKMAHGYKQRELSIKYRIHQPNISNGFKKISKKITEIFTVLSVDLYKEYPEVIDILSEEDKPIYKLMLVGYNQAEISRDIGKSKVFISRHVKTIYYRILSEKEKSEYGEDILKYPETIRFIRSFKENFND